MNRCPHCNKTLGNRPDIHVCEDRWCDGRTIEEQTQDFWQHHLHLYTVITTPEERIELDKWYKDYGFFNVETWWGLENDVHFYARLKEAKVKWEERKLEERKLDEQNT